MIPTCTAERAHAGERIARPLTEWDTAIARTLLATVHHIEVRVEMRGQVVHLFPQRPVSTTEEVLVLRQFIEFSDSPLHFHRYDVVWTKAGAR